MQVRRYKPGEEEEIWQLYHDTTHIINGEVYTKEQVERWAPHDYVLGFDRGRIFIIFPERL